jgi:actin related protein 2/3 complex subunit 1A/1B
MKARVFSAWVKGIDPKASSAVWGDKLPFGTVCAEFDAGGWVHSVSFSPSGNQIAFTSHDSSISIADGPNSLYVIKTSNLPFLSAVWCSESILVVAGHDCTPYLVLKNSTSWVISQKIDGGKKKGTSGNSAFNKFKQMDSKSQATDDSELDTTHQNTITSVRAFRGTNDRVTHFSTTGVDGQLVIWDILAAGVQNIRL